ncbi:MAG: CPBP family glutamic-type intramembrane protease [Pyrinomonadaceae bacterium]
MATADACFLGNAHTIYRAEQQARSRQSMVKQAARFLGLVAVSRGCRLSPVHCFLQNWRLLSSVWIWLPWLLFALINPWLEKGYWRGLLLDASAKWKTWASVLYTSAVYAASHPLMWGVKFTGEPAVCGMPCFRTCW